MKGRKVRVDAVRALLAAAVGLALCLGSAQAQQPTDMPQKAKTKSSAGSSYRPVVEPRAMDLIKAMSDKLAAAKSMSFMATVGYEYPSKLGPPIVYTTRHEVAM